jgi:hypothetical protein
MLEANVGKLATLEGKNIHDRGHAINRREALAAQYREEDKDKLIFGVIV